MHNALYVEEILLSIFVYCYVLKRHVFSVEPYYANRDLASLARTCRTFKDLALDMIWAELPNLTPLVRCLPNVSSVDLQGVYSFRRQLEVSEWETLRKYTSRVRVLVDLRNTSGLAVDCVHQLSNPPNSAESFFPKLHKLELYQISSELYPLVLRHFTSPQLRNLTLAITGSHGSIFRSFGQLCPNVDNFRAIESGPYAETISDLICHWSNLRNVACYRVVLSFTALSHLSTLPTVSSLAFTINDTLVDHFPDIPPLPFSALSHLSTSSGSLVPLWRMFRRISLPVIHSINVSLIQVHPTPTNFFSMLTALGEACSHESLDSLSMWVPEDEITTMADPPPCRLTFNLLRPLMVFHNLQTISLDVVWGVDLTESELLDLASSWPRLISLELGDHGDWTVSSGITPEGFVRLLERCKSLRVLYVILNTRGYTEIPRGHPWRGRTMPKNTFIHLLNSPIEEDAIEALGVFFHVAPYPYFGLTTHWNNSYFQGKRPQAQESAETYYSRWVKARDIARDLSKRRRKLLKAIRARNSGGGPAVPAEDSESDIFTELDSDV